MEFLLIFIALVLLMILIINNRRSINILNEKMDNVEFITGILRAAYNADHAEKIVNESEDFVNANETP